MIDLIDPWRTDVSSPAGSEPTRPTLVAGVLTAAVGWAIVLPVGLFALAAAPFLVAHPSKVVAFAGSAYLVLPVVLGVLCVRLGPRVVDRAASRLWAGLVVGAVGSALIVLALASGRWLWGGWFAYTPSLQRYVRIVGTFAGIVALAVAALLATPAVGRDFAANREAGSTGCSGRRSGGAIRVTTAAVATLLVMSLLAAAARR